MEWPRMGTLLMVVLVLVLLLPIAEAAVPRQIAISGLRTNTSGGAEKNFFHSNVNFTIFDSQAGGRMLDTRERNVSTNTNGYWFINYSTSGFDTEVDLWLSINNTSPRIFLGPEPYSSQYLRRNESNSVNSSLTLQGTANIRGFQSTSLVNTTHVNASALGYAAIPVTATGVNLFSNLLSAANTFSGENTFSARQIFGNITLQQNLTHSIGGILINQTGGVNASAVGFGSVPVGVLDLLLSTAQTWTATQTFSARQIFGNITLQQNLTHSIGGILINQTGGINASAVGFGSIPQGVLDTARTWTTAQTFTAIPLFSAGARFGSSLNVSGAVNITGVNAASIDNAFSVFDATGFRVFNLEVFSLLTSIAGSVNVTATASAANVFTVRGLSFVDIFRVDAIGAGMIHTQGTLNVTNVTHQVGGLLINTTGGINASAVGFGRLPDGVIPVYNNTGSVPLAGIYQFGRNVTDCGGSCSSTVTPTSILITLGRSYSCRLCFSVAVAVTNATGGGAEVAGLMANPVSANSFNVSAALTGGLNFTWMTMGY